MQKSKICFFNSNKEWGGGEKWHFEMACNLFLNDFDILVVAQPKSVLLEKIKTKGINSKSVKLNNISFLNPIKIFQLVKLFRQNNINILILNLPSDLKAAGLAAKIAGVKKIIYRRGSAIAVKNTFINRFYYRKIINFVIANSKATKNKILEKNSNLIANNKIHVIYNGIDVKEFDKIISMPERFGNKNEIIIGNLGRLVKQKAQEYFIDLAFILKEKNIPFKIVIGGDGKRKQDLQAYAKSKNVDDKIIWVGFVNNVKQFMKSIDVFVLTSHWEGFGYVLAEAMVAKKPVIAFNVSSNPELIKDKVNGYLIEPYNISKVAEQIIFIKNNPEKAKELGENGRHFIENDFRPQDSYSSFVNLITNFE